MKRLNKFLKENSSLFIRNFDELLKELNYGFQDEQDENRHEEMLCLEKAIIEHNLNLVTKEKNRSINLKERLLKLQQLALEDNSVFEEQQSYDSRKTISQIEPLNIDSYFFHLLHCQSKEEILSALPKEDEIDYTAKINSILLQIKLEINSYIIMLKDSTEDEKSEYQKEINSLRLLLNIIIENKKQTLEEEINTPTPNIYFLTRENGDNTSLIEDDLLSIITNDNERDFRKLIDDFIDGRFISKASNKSNGHGFNSSDNRLKGLQEVKHNQARITYYNLGQGNYILIKAFVKKDNSSLVVTNNLLNNYELFKKREEDIRKRLNDPEYNVEQSIYLENVLKLVNKQTGGENNEKNN